MPEWAAYKLDMKGVGAVTGPSELKFVHHVTHISIARQIMRDGQIKAGLIYDESKLNQTRTCVTWLSPNTWGLGSLYGNVQFSFDWMQIIKDRRLYWVEDIKKYSPPAYRLLVTDRTLTKADTPVAYNPVLDEGPIRLHGGKWYWRSDRTCELMLDANLRLNDCVDFYFIDHHKTYCSATSGCEDRNLSIYDSGAQVFASILAGNIHSLDHVLSRPIMKDRPLSAAARNGIDGLASWIGGCDFDAKQMKVRSKRAVMRGVLALFGSDQRDAAMKLMASLRSEKEARRALEAVIDEHFALAEGYKIS